MSSYKIFPPLGVARVGNAPQAFYIAPETYCGLPTRPQDGQPITSADLRDAQQRLCRQAARFGVYRKVSTGRGEDENTAWEEVTLATPGVKAIVWTVHVANKKASWYVFNTNAGERGYASTHPLRNPKQEDRRQLVIDFGPRSISGANAPAQPISRSTAPEGYTVHFPDRVLQPGNIRIDDLGELRTDAKGRLLFLGGLGKAGTTDADPALPDYANNDDWWDDTSDGPIHAEVVYGDRREDAGTAWVMVGPPSYAPEIPNLVTLWDTIFNGAVREGHFPQICKGGFWQRGKNGYRPNFKTEIGPLIERAALFPWVSAIPPKAHVFDMDRLGHVPESPQQDTNRGLRQWILGVMRPPTEENVLVGGTGRVMMPYLAGDNILNPETFSSKYLRLTDTQYFFLQQWADGWFCNEDRPVSKPWALTRGVLDNCVGGAFSPGIEMGWIARNRDIFQDDDPLRLNAAWPTKSPLRLDFDPERMQPGDICRYMAVPWQADFNECAAQPDGDRVLWWWPSQRPEFVYARDTGQDVVRQVAWVGTDFDQQREDYVQFAENLQMVTYWSKLGFVMKQPDTAVPAGAEASAGKRRESAVYTEVQRVLARPFYPPHEPQ